MMDLDKLAKDFLGRVRPYKPGKPIEQLLRERDIASVIKLASNENPYPPPERIKQAVLAALENTNRYPESGSPVLTKKLAARHGVNNNEILVANGTNEILDLLVRAYVYPDENCVFSELSFVIYRLICQQCGVKRVEVPSKDYKHDLDAMAEAITDKTKLVFVCNPNNPTSTYNTAAELDRFLARVPDHALVILDEAYFEFVNVPDYPDCQALRSKHQNIVVLRTFSKFFSLAGARVGYAIADPRVIDILNKVRQPFNVSRLAQAAAVAALDCAEELSWFVNETIQERGRIRDAILELDCVCPPSQTNFLFVLPQQFSGDICKKLEERGIIVRPMAPFGAPENAFRVNTGTPAENDQLLVALTEILKSG